MLGDTLDKIHTERRNQILEWNLIQVTERSAVGKMSQEPPRRTEEKNFYLHALKSDLLAIFQETWG